MYRLHSAQAGSHRCPVSTATLSFGNGQCMKWTQAINNIYTMEEGRYQQTAAFPFSGGIQEVIKSAARNANFLGILEYCVAIS